LHRFLIGVAGVLCILLLAGLFGSSFWAALLVSPLDRDRWLEVEDIILLLSGGTGLILTILFIAYAAKSAAVPREERGLWIAVLIFANFLALPFFWYWYMWSPRPAVTSGPST
jgi:hypothetical protein